MCVRTCIIPDLDPILESAIFSASPEFGISLKRRLTNAGVSGHLKLENTELPDIKFDDHFIRKGENTIALTEIRTQYIPAKIKRVEPILAENCILVNISWYNLTIKGRYEIINHELRDFFPINSTTGELEIQIDNINANGYIGFDVVNDVLRSSNFDLIFRFSNITIKGKYLDLGMERPSIASTVCNNLDNSIAAYLKDDIIWMLRESLRKQLDCVLLDFTLDEIFHDSGEVITKYRDHTIALNTFVNQIVDNVLDKVKMKFISGGKNILGVPDIESEFYKKFGLITFWGVFRTKNGTLSDLTRIKRIGNFSLYTDKVKGDLIAFGEFGIDKLELKYNFYRAEVWNLGVEGSLTAIPSRNAFDMKIVTNLFDWPLKMKYFKVKITQLEDINVDATGFSIILDWLFSKIISWTISHLKQDVVDSLEKIMNGVIKIDV